MTRASFETFLEPRYLRYVDVDDIPEYRRPSLQPYFRALRWEIVLKLADRHYATLRRILTTYTIRSSISLRSFGLKERLSSVSGPRILNTFDMLEIPRRASGESFAKPAWLSSPRSERTSLSLASERSTRIEC